jgi:hypothetical protein
VSCYAKRRLLSVMFPDDLNCLLNTWRLFGDRGKRRAVAFDLYK